MITAQQGFIEFCLGGGGAIVLYCEIRRGEGLVWVENLISGQCSGGGGGRG